MKKIFPIQFWAHQLLWRYWSMKSHNFFSIRSLPFSEWLTGFHNYVELIFPHISLRTCVAKITAVEHLNDDTVLITLRPNRLWKGNHAGQYVGLGVVVNGKRMKRYYSPLTNHTTQKAHRHNDIVIGITRHPGGVVSNYLVDHAHTGMRVSIADVGGEFTLDDALPHKIHGDALPHKIHGDALPHKIRFFSAGSGFTAIISLLRELSYKKYSGSVFIAHYGPSYEKIACKKLFSALGEQFNDVRVIFGLTQQRAADNADNPNSDGDEYVFGRVTAEHCGEFADPAIPTFACGPAGFVDSIRNLTDPRYFYSEVFTPFLAAHKHDDTIAHSVAVRCSKTDDCVQGSTTQTILDTLLDNNINVEYGCKMGICYHCTAIKKIGTVRNIITNDICTDPDVSIQLCINVPQSDIEVEV